MNSILILLGKTILFLSRTFNLGSGSTWPGHVAMETNPKFVRQVIKKNPNLKVVLVAGTNGKTTTSLMLQEILQEGGLKVFRNEAGANLLNGIASSIIANINLTGRLNFDVAIFEVDERNVELALKEIHPNVILFLNIFRDQLDRYGEVNQVLKDWGNALSMVKNSTLLTNGDDPALAHLAKKSGLKTFLFGIDDKFMIKNMTGHDVDFIYCPNCQTKLDYKKNSFSHMGDFTCPKCKFKRENIEQIKLTRYPLFGIYNIYNTNAAALIANKIFDVSAEKINRALKTFKPAFGRQEEINYKGRKILMLLSKNPAGFNQSISTLSDFIHPRGENVPTPRGCNILLILNDRIPDGRDVSWIWDLDFENLPKDSKIFISGDRAHDMALRIKYSQLSDVSGQLFEDLREAIENAVSETKPNETLFILPTYSAMLESRKILTGRSIL
ncbi:MAG: DUF1727 domain-containing protein [Candidatus Levybacteria bacterium]|nr:DUF1727 domain-containing protein [Candidatus Levybacteria bacterium]